MCDHEEIILIRVTLPSKHQLILLSYTSTHLLQKLIGS